VSGDILTSACCGLEEASQLVEVGMNKFLHCGAVLVEGKPGEAIISKKGGSEWHSVLVTTMTR